MGQEAIAEAKATLVFTYGTLKRGFSNHVVMQDLILSGDASFRGVYRTAEKFPLVCGPYRVPFLLNIPGAGQRVTGELYAVSPQGLARLDELEGLSRGHYIRHQIRVGKAEGKEDVGWEEEWCEAYYAHKSYEEELWKRNGGRSFGEYTAKEASGYVKRKDRPPHLSFLDHIRIFLSSPPDSLTC